MSPDIDNSFLGEVGEITPWLKATVLEKHRIIEFSLNKPSLHIWNYCFPTLMTVQILYTF